MNPTPMHIPEGQDPNLTHTLWALDMDDHGNPTRAHRVTDIQCRHVKTRPDAEETRVTACGMKLTVRNYPSGWWLVPHGELPLADVSKIHCGLLP